jgi:hypothetical protein
MVLLVRLILEATSNSTARLKERSRVGLLEVKTAGFLRSRAR